MYVSNSLRIWIYGKLSSVISIYLIIITFKTKIKHIHFLNYKLHNKVFSRAHPYSMICGMLKTTHNKENQMLKPFPSWPLLIFYDTSNQIQSFQMVFKVFRFSSFSSFLGFLSQTEQIRETTTQTNSGLWKLSFVLLLWLDNSKIFVINKNN